MPKNKIESKIKHTQNKIKHNKTKQYTLGNKCKHHAHEHNTRTTKHINCSANAKETQMQDRIQRQRTHRETKHDRATPSNHTAKQNEHKRNHSNQITKEPQASANQTTLSQK